MNLRQAELYPGGHGRGLETEATLTGAHTWDALAEPRQALAALLPRFHRPEMSPWLPAATSLLEESHPKIFFTELLHLASEMGRLTQAQEALPLFQAVRDQALFPDLAAAAEDEIKLLSGGGDLGQRIEAQLSALPDLILDGPTLAGMFVGGAAYRLGRGTLLRWLLPTGTRAAVPEVLAMRGAASLGGLTLEAPLFTGVTHALHPQEGFDARTSIAHAALTLGSLRTVGWAARSLGTTPWVLRTMGEKAPQVLAHGGMLGGIVTAEGLARTWGLQAHGDPLPLGLQALITWAQFQGAGVLYHRLAPQRLQQWEQSQDLKVEVKFLPRINKNQFPNFPDFEKPLAWAHAGMAMSKLPELKVHDPVLLPNRLYMTGEGKGETITRKRTPQEENFLRYLPEQSREMAIEIDQKFGESAGFLRILAAGAPKDLRMMHPLDYHYPIIRLWWIVQNSEISSKKGGYFPWITSIWFHHALAKGDVTGVRGLLYRLGHGGTLKEMEKFYSGHLSDARIEPYHDFAREFGDPSISSFDRAISDIRLDQKSENILLQLAQRVDQSPDPTGPFPFRYIQFLLGLDFYLGNTRRSQQGTIETILHQLPDQPLAQWRLLRLFQLTHNNHRDPFGPSKLAELADLDISIDGKIFDKLTLHPDQVPNSQWDAYMGEKGPHRWIPTEMSEAKEWIESIKKSNNQFRRQSNLVQLLQTRSNRHRALNTKEWVQAFRSLGDAISLEVADLLSSSQLRLEVLPPAAYKIRYQALHQRGIDNPPPGTPQLTEQMKNVIRQIKKKMLEKTKGEKGKLDETTQEEPVSLAHYFVAGLEGPKAILLVREPPLKYYSRPTGAEAVFQLMAAMVHEARHHMDLQGKSIFETPAEKAITEMNAYTLEALWRAQHGDTIDLETYLAMGATGPALHLRDRLEFDNLIY